MDLISDTPDIFIKSYNNKTQGDVQASVSATRWETIIFVNDIAIGILMTHDKKTSFAK